MVHPRDPTKVLTCSYDGTARMMDVNAAQFTEVSPPHLALTLPPFLPSPRTAHPPACHYRLPTAAAAPHLVRALGIEDTDAVDAVLCTDGK